MITFYVILVCLSLAASEQCETKNYMKIGCYKRNPTLLPDYVLTARESGKDISSKKLIDWSNFGSHLKSFACECSEKIKNQYKFFAIGYYGECFAGNDMSALDNMLRNTDAATDCLSGDEYKSCNNTDDTECTGVANSEYIYKLSASAPTVVNGGYSSFSNWTKCDKTCGEGVQVRERSCNNPVPSNNGKDCSEFGNSTESRKCKITDCPVNGGWSDFGSYSDCSTTCGNGQKTKTRKCNNPSPANGGADCVGSETETASCKLQNCPVNGGWSDFGSYSSCSKTCGDGQKTKTRKCNNPSPANDGADCIGSETETASCKLQNCPAYTAYHANHVCEGDAIRLYCPENWVIKFEGGDYFYGRKNKETCKENKKWYDSLNTCSKDNTNKKIYDACQNKNECTVEATNSWFGGDPCNKNPKYVYVNFRCYGYNLM